MRALLALIAVTAVWGVTFVQVKDAVALYPLFAFLAVRFAIASLALAVPAAGRMRSLGRPGWIAGTTLGLLLAAGYALQTAGLERTTVSSAGFITGLYVVFTPLLALLLFRARIGRAVWLGVLLSIVRTRAADRGRRGGHGRRPAGSRRLGRLLPADRPDGAVRAALRPGRVHPGGDARRVRGLRGRRGRARPGRSAARLDGLERPARHGRLCERARRSSCRRGRSGGRARRRRHSRSRWSRSGRASSASGSRGTGWVRSAGRAAR